MNINCGKRRRKNQRIRIVPKATACANEQINNRMTREPSVKDKSNPKRDETLGGSIPTS
jgi:hypothetical protein